MEIFRTANEDLAKAVDAMGPPIASLNITSTLLTFTDTAAVPTWNRLWYRAVTWSAKNDFLGLVEMRSDASAPSSVLFAPPVGPAIANIRVNEPRSNAQFSLISWTTSAPVPDTPIGPHRLIAESRDAAGQVRVRLDQLTPVALPALPGPVLAGKQIFKVSSATGTRFFAWFPRLGDGSTFRVLLKVIDPLGRMGLADAAVPPLPATPPVITSIDPAGGHPGEIVTIHGTALVLAAGDPVEITLELPSDPNAPNDRGPLAVIGGTTPTRNQVKIPEIQSHADHVDAPLVLVRSDGQTAISGEPLGIALL